LGHIFSTVRSDNSGEYIVSLSYVQVCTSKQPSCLELPSSLHNGLARAWQRHLTPVPVSRG